MPQYQPTTQLKTARVCQKCTRTFYTSNYRVQQGGGLYCSLPCRIAVKQNAAGAWTTTRTCVCGKEFTGPRQQKTCSHACATHPGRPTGDAIERFWSFVDRNGPVPEHRPELGQCWVWNGGAAGIGEYGNFWLDGKTVAAHRYGFEIQKGPIPNGENVCHHCDLKLCVRGEHLFAGSQRENVQDMMQKGRYTNAFPSGKLNPSYKLSDENKTRILEMSKDGTSQQKIADSFNVSQALISRIVTTAHGVIITRQ